MEASQIYILISIITLLVIGILFIFIAKKKKKRNAMTPLTGLAFGFIIAGIVFGDDRRIGYSLMGIGVLLAIVDMFRKLRKK